MHMCVCVCVCVHVSACFSRVCDIVCLVSEMDFITGVDIAKILVALL